MYRIFLVEDDRALALELQRQLEQCGNEVRLVSDFRAVLDEVRAYDPQLVLMDIMLPYQNGYYWTAEIRKFSTVPIVFLSSASDGMNIVMAINMGGDDFIPKPVEPMVLCAKVQAVLRRMNGSRENVLDTAMACGFTSSSGFYKTFRVVCGMPPRAYLASRQDD